MKEPKEKAASLRGKKDEAKGKSASELSIGDISDILTMLSTHDVVEFEFERGDQKLWLKRAGADTAVVPNSQVVNSVTQPMVAVSEIEVLSASEPRQAAPVASANVNPDASAEQVLPSSVGTEVKSPMVGTFYRRPAVDADPYVEVGDMVKKGDVLCIVEAMKIMNEIETDTAGRVVEVCLDDGQMVEYGEVMFRIEPNK